MSQNYRAPRGPRGYHGGPSTGNRGFRNASGPRITSGSEAAPDPLLDAATSGAEQLVMEYYEATNGRRHNVASFYVASTPERPTTVVFNGIELADGRAAQDIFEQITPQSHIEVETIDCQILNTNYLPAANNVSDGRNAARSCSILVNVGGLFKASNDRNEDEEDFNDSMIIVPNPDTGGHRGPRGPRHKDYLIQTQNFRLLSGENPEESANQMIG